MKNYRDIVLSIFVLIILSSFLQAQEKSVKASEAFGKEFDSQKAQPSPPNIIIILADDMGYSDPGYMGGEAQTPNLDQLSHDGVTFLNCFNNAKCAPSRAALMTGLSSQRVKSFKSAGNIAENNAASIAEVLGANGYKTIISGKWHINPKPMEIGFQRQLGVNLMPYYFKPDVEHSKKLQPIYLDGVPINLADLPDDWYSTTAYTDFAIKTIDEDAISKKKPFFLYLAPNAPHEPLFAPKEDVDKYVSSYDAGIHAVRQKRYQRMVEKGVVDPKLWKLPSYEKDKNIGEINWENFSDKEQAFFKRKLAVTAGMIDRLDQNVGRLIHFLKDRGVYDNTLIIFLSDNGATGEKSVYGGLPFEQMSDADISTIGIRGGMGGGTAGPVIATLQNTPLRGFKTSLWDGGMRTSMSIHWPSNMCLIATENYVRDPVAIFDIAPTCYQAAGVNYPSKISGRKLQPMDGVSLIPLMKNQKLSARNLCYSYKDDRVVRNERWKLFGTYNTRKDKAGPWKLYDLSVDKSEINDVAISHPEIVRDLASEWNEWDQEIGVIKGYKEFWVNIDDKKSGKLSNMDKKKDNADKKKRKK